MQELFSKYEKYESQEKMATASLYAALIATGVMLLSSQSWGFSGLAVLIAIVSHFVIQNAKHKREEVRIEYQEQLKHLPLEREMVKMVTIDGNDVFMEFESGDFSHKSAEVVKTRIKEPFFEYKKKPDGLERIKEFEEQFPLPILFIPVKENPKVVFVAEKKTVSEKE